MLFNMTEKFKNGRKISFEQISQFLLTFSMQRFLIQVLLTNSHYLRMLKLHDFKQSYQEWNASISCLRFLIVSSIFEDAPVSLQRIRII